MKNRIKRAMGALGLIAVLALGACQKNESDREPTCRIAAYTAQYINSNGTTSSSSTNFAYDAEGKLTSVSTGSFSQLFTYESNKMVSTWSNPAGYRVEYLLNADGQPTTKLNVSNKITWTYTYDNAGYLTKYTYNSGTSNRRLDNSFIYSGGNLTSLSVTDTNNGNSSTSTYAMDYSDKPYKRPQLYLADTDGYYAGGPDQFPGKPSKNLLKRVIGSNGFDTTYDYTLDANGYIKTVTETVNRNGKLDIVTNKTYTYECL